MRPNNKSDRMNSIVKARMLASARGEKQLGLKGDALITFINRIEQKVIRMRADRIRVQNESHERIDNAYRRALDDLR